MGWKFWQKNEPATAFPDNKAQKLGRPRELPQEVGGHLVRQQGFDPDWIWSLKCVRKPRENSKSVFDIRIFSLETAERHGVRVRDYASLEDHMNLVIFTGWYEKGSQRIQLEQLIEKAV